MHNGPHRRSAHMRRMIAEPVARATASNLIASLPPAASGTDRRDSPTNCTIAGSRLRISTAASPPDRNVLVTTAPNEARSPRVRNLGNAGNSVTGFDTRMSVPAVPKRESVSPATAMMR